MKITVPMLRRIVKEEVGKFGKMEDPADKEKDTEEVDADEYADTLEKQIDYAKALGIEEARLRSRLRRIHERRMRIIKRAKNSK